MTEQRRDPIYARDIKKHTDQYVSNILALYDLASAEDLDNGRSWYQRACTFCRTLAENYERTLADVAGIMAVLSPACSFEQNVIDTVNVLAANDDQPVSTYGKQHAKAIEIRDYGIDPVDVLGKNKTNAFWLNIVNPTTASRVTVDRHATRIAVDWQMDSDEAYYYNNTEAKYNVIERAYLLAAERLDILPHVLQAITWITYRRVFGRITNGHEALERKRRSVADLASDLPF